MKKKTAKRFSLKSGLLAMILACWLIPIVIVLMVAGAFFERTYSQTIEQEIDFSAQKAMEQVQSRLEEAIAASKSVSYDGTSGRPTRAIQRTATGRSCTCKPMTTCGYSHGPACIRASLSTIGRIPWPSAPTT